MKYEINYNLLTVNISVPAKYFSEKEIKVKKEAYTPVESTGFFLEYDSVYSKLSNSYNFNTNFDINYFFKNSVFFSGFVYRKDEEESKLLRTDTTLRIDQIDKIRKIEIGDVSTQDSFWNSGLRIGGIRIASDFSLRPDIITYPLPDFAGETAVPSSVDIFIENAKVFSKELKPGPFEIRDIPVISPEGNMRVVIRDVLGREKVIEIPYMTDLQLLKKGLHQYSYSLGFVRKDYLVKNFKYHNLIGVGSHKFGVSNKLTLEFGGYFDGYKKFSFGTSIYYLLGKIGLINPKVAYSYNADVSKTGYLFGIDYSKDFDFFRFRINYQRSSDYFVQPQTVFGTLKEIYNAIAGLNTPLGSLSLSYFKRTYFDPKNPESQSLNLTYNRTFFKKINFNLSVGRFESDEKNTFVRASMSAPLGQHSTSLNYQNNENEQSYSFEISKNPSFEKGLAYAFRANKTNGSQLYEGRLNYETEYASLSSDINYTSGSDISYRLGISGSLIYLDKSFFVRRAVQNSFGIVKIEPPVEGAEIVANNRPIGKTDKKGTLFIPYLSPYYPNEITINPESLDIKTEIEKNMFYFIPYRGHGYIFKFKSKKVNSIRIKIVFPNGEFPPPGTRFDVDNRINAGILGFKGKAFIENITEGEHTIKIDYGYGQCSFKIKIDSSIMNKVVPYIGEYKCIPEGNNSNFEVKKEKSSQKVKKEEVKTKSVENSAEKKKEVLSEKKEIKQSSSSKKLVKNNKKYFYTIQIAAFKSKENAERFLKQIKIKNTFLFYDKTFYRVVIGKFETKRDAKEFKVKNKIDGIIKKFKNDEK